jgi:hypothetical protein
LRVLADASIAFVVGEVSIGLAAIAGVGWNSLTVPVAARGSSVNFTLRREVMN